MHGKYGGWLIGATILCAGAPALAYQIGSASIAKKGYDLHESFSRVARSCLDSGAATKGGCASYFPEALRLTGQRKSRAANDEPYASRWPDDPTRMLDRDPSKIRFGIHLYAICDRALARGSAIDQVGLLCSSHFGRLQFMHAQATSEDRDDSETRSKILAWATFAYRAATDAEFRATDYCKAVAGVPDQSLRAALTLSDVSICETRSSRFLGIFPRTYKGWTVATLFSLSCPNPLQEKVCWERTGSYGDETARIAAKGALLHLVQDSFSQSHVARVPAGGTAPGARGPYTARVVCERPAVYYNYVTQNRSSPDDNGAIKDDPHGAADGRPELDSSCLAPGRKVDDIITASAIVLYYLDHPDQQAFETYLRTRVFPM